MSLRFTAIAALLIASVSAQRCGQVKVTSCSDDQCAVDCQTKEMEFQGCSSFFIEQKMPSGSVGARCNGQRTMFKFYEAEGCTGSTYLADKEYFYDTCYPNADGSSGSFKVSVEGTERPQFFELTEAEYEERFNQRWMDSSDFNVLGYGQKNLFVPPIRTVTWLINEIDRWYLVITSSPLMPFFTEAFLKASWTGDFWNGFTWYNNAAAAGEQLYPSGINKYFDMFSLQGWFNYTFYWMWMMFCQSLSPFTLGIPLNIWLGIINGLSWEGWWKMFMPTWIIWIFHLRGENGWILA